MQNLYNNATSRPYWNYFSMDGVFMFKLLRRMMALFFVLAALYSFSLIRDRRLLNDQVIRLHVVGASNSTEDQSIKLSVRDAILERIKTLTADSTAKAEVQQILADNLDLLKEIANTVLRKAGMEQRAQVTLQKESFETREYDTFTMPAGVYDSLRIVIGDGEGKNWWCVVFPSLCNATASTEVEDVAVSAGLSEDLSKSITRENGYEVRFFFLDWLGRLQNFAKEH